MAHETKRPPPRTKTAAPVGAVSGVKTGNQAGDFDNYYSVGRPLTSRYGFQRYEPWGGNVLLTLGLCSSGYILRAAGTSCHFETFEEAYNAAWTLNYFANRTVFIDAALESELRSVR